jgi:hypothetical protein
LTTLAFGIEMKTLFLEYLKKVDFHASLENAMLLKRTTVSNFTNTSLARHLFPKASHFQVK